MFDKKHNKEVEDFWKRKHSQPLVHLFHEGGERERHQKHVELNEKRLLEDMKFDVIKKTSVVSDKDMQIIPIESCVTCQLSIRKR